MDDLISRQAAMTMPVLPKEHRDYISFELDDIYEQGWNECQRFIAKLPSTDRTRGEWVEEDEYGDLWVCDQCGFASEHRDNYCPNCGKNMRGEAE